MYPQPSFDIDCVRDRNNIPKSPIGGMSFSAFKSVPGDADEHTEATMDETIYMDCEYDDDLDSPRKVRFFERVEVQQIRHHNTLTEMERHAIWMSPIEFKENKSNMKKTVLRMMSGETNDDDIDFCTRGLESKTRSGSKTRSENKLLGRSAVLNEQDLQREEEFNDPQFIAMVSMEVSFKCKEEAYRRGEKDASFALSYLSDVLR